MTRAKISQYSATANDNTDVNGINIAENCPPSSMNNMGREIMAALKRFQTGSDGDGVTVGGSLVVSGSTTANTFSATAVNATGTVTFSGSVILSGTTTANTFSTDLITEKTSAAGVTIDGVLLKDSLVGIGADGSASAPAIYRSNDTNTGIFFPAADTIAFAEGGAEAMRISSAGSLFVGTTSLGTVGSSSGFQVTSGGSVYSASTSDSVFARRSTDGDIILFRKDTTNVGSIGTSSGGIYFGSGTTPTERMRIDSSGNLLVGKTDTTFATAGLRVAGAGLVQITRASAIPLEINRTGNDGNLVEFYQASTLEGAISVSGNTVTYGAFCGGHWTQLKEGRGYNPAIPRGTVMSSIGEMAVWKSVEWTETVEHPAVEAVEAVEAVLDEDGNVLEPAVEAVEGKEAWTESIPHRESYLGNLDIGEIFEEDGFAKTVVDDGNERLPKVKISDVIGDKAVYGVFQTWDDVEDMLITSLGAFVVRIAAGVTVEIGDLLESNGDGCAKVQDDDIIRSKTIGKVTSTVATDTYDDGSYTVPCVLYCG